MSNLTDGLIERLRTIQECIASGESVFPDAASMLDAISAYADLETPLALPTPTPAGN